LVEEPIESSPGESADEGFATPAVEFADDETETETATVVEEPTETATVVEEPTETAIVVEEPTESTPTEVPAD
jgi:hypothetical protein